MGKASIFLRSLVAVASLISATRCEENPRPWDLLVAVEGQVQLLDFDGNLLDTAVQNFTKLKALVFDDLQNKLIFSNTDRYNDTIYGVQLTKETEVTPIVSDLSDDVQGLAIDTFSQTLYWTDATNGVINSVDLRDPTGTIRVFKSFADQNPQDIAIDSCGRYIYWTNSDMSNPSIEKSHLNGSNHRIIVKKDLFMPAGIAFDQNSGRIYWADMSEGIYFTIESADVNGDDRHVLYKGTHQKPYAVAVTSDSIFWTDINNNAIWKKRISSEERPVQLRTFKKRPMGLVVRNSYANCTNSTRIIKEETVTTDAPSIENSFTECLNNGQVMPDGCKCPRGFLGPHCEISLCHNYCLNGHCYFSSLGTPKCKCSNEFDGNRCEIDVCSKFCLNQGICIYSNETNTPSCQCQDGYFGDRCERSIAPSDICQLFCQGKETNILIDKLNTFTCICEEGSYKLSETRQFRAFEIVATEDSSVLDQLKNPTCLILAAICLVLTVTAMILTCFVVKRRRPRIKKRIIVNRNVTPLSYTPGQRGQCEITIENCCNMNVCETPCFEPPNLCTLNRKDEKKLLLTHMENGEDFY